MQKYNMYLSEIERLMHKTTTTNSYELNTIGKKIFGNRFVGVFASDEIPNLHKGQSAIINIDDSSEPGSHWIAVINHQDIGIVVYDSFGRVARVIIPSIIQRYPHAIDTEHDAEQDLGKHIETNCGQRSLAFLKLAYEDINLALLI